MGADTDAPLADRHARGVAAYARIFGVPENRLAAPCILEDHEEVTLEFLMEDYISHMENHLSHVL